MLCDSDLSVLLLIDPQERLLPAIANAEVVLGQILNESMRERKFAMDRWRIDVDDIKNHPGFGPVTVSYENAYNVVGTYRPARQTGRSLILNGHIDVVPTGPQPMWTRSPWDPAIIDGWMYGRGAADMKAGLAVNGAAMVRSRRPYRDVPRHEGG